MAWSTDKAAAEEIKARAAKHLAFQHFQAIDAPFHGTRAPGQGDPRFDRGIVLVQPCGEALYGLHRTSRGRCSQRSRDSGCRWRTSCVNAWASSMASVTSACCSRNCASCCASASVRFVSRRSTNQVARRGVKGWHAGSATAGRGWRGRGAQGRPGPAATGGHRLHYPIASRIATLAEVAKQSHRVVAPRIPALEEIRLIGVEATLPEVTATPAPGKGGGPEIALDRAQTQPDRCAMAGAVQPSRCKAQICVCSACRWAWRCAARCCAGSGMLWGGTGTAIAPSDSGTACWCSRALTASSAWLCVRNTWSSASRRFWNK